jgi:hypothetical protein
MERSDDWNRSVLERLSRSKQRPIPGRFHIESPTPSPLLEESASGSALQALTSRTGLPKLMGVVLGFGSKRKKWDETPPP